MLEGPKGLTFEFRRKFKGFLYFPKLRMVIIPELLLQAKRSEATLPPGKEQILAENLIQL